MEEVKNVRGGKPVDLSKPNPGEQPKKLPQTQEIVKKSREKDFNKVPQKKSILLLWILSTITLGIYPAIWYMSKSIEFYNLGTNKQLPRILAITFLVLQIIGVVILLIFPFTITSEMGTFYQNLSTIQQTMLILLGLIYFFRIVLSLILAFVSKGIINEALEKNGHMKKISGLFTLVFTFLYLQYEINRITQDKEDTKRTGPWAWFIIIIVLIAAGIVINFI